MVFSDLSEKNDENVAANEETEFTEYQKVFTSSEEDDDENVEFRSSEVVPQQFEKEWISKNLSAVEFFKGLLEKTQKDLRKSIVSFDQIEMSEYSRSNFFPVGTSIYGISIARAITDFYEENIAEMSTEEGLVDVFIKYFMNSLLHVILVGALQLIILSTVWGSLEYLHVEDSSTERNFCNGEREDAFVISVWAVFLIHLLPTLYTISNEIYLIRHGEVAFVPHVGILDGDNTYLSPVAITSVEMKPIRENIPLKEGQEAKLDRHSEGKRKKRNLLGRGIAFCIVAIETVVFVAVAVVGSLYIISSASINETVQATVVIVFINEIDDMVANIFFEKEIHQYLPQVFCFPRKYHSSMVKRASVVSKSTIVESVIRYISLLCHPLFISRILFHKTVGFIFIIALPSIIVMLAQRAFCD